MITSAAEKEYAKALFMLALRTDKIDTIGEEFAELVQLVEGNRTIKNFLLAPQLSAKKKHRLIKTAFEGRIDKHLFKFLQVLIDKRRQDLLTGIYEAYTGQVNEHYNRVEVSASSAVELTGEEREALKSKFSRHLDRTVVIKTTVDPSLLGGLVCQIGDKVLDGSLRGKLERMGRQILKE
ncbi:MAG: F0F1 ATP synthase subunit delta [Gemmatimonadota bacterium]|nr:F0F1 ATP synthase subunit delta [Gemmatimonadota bacterium]